MNYQLGRLSERADYLHLARCKRCQKRLLNMEKEIEREAFELKEQQSRGFGAVGAGLKRKIV